MESNQTAYYKTPIGTAKITGDINGISSVTVIDDVIETSIIIPEYLQECVQQLDDYFKGIRKQFNLKLNPQGTDFQKRVWDELLNVEYGKTRTYLEQTKKLGDVKAIRAVASANGKNPIWIIIPCHRIIGSNGDLTGYAGGIWRKKWLLEHENTSTQQLLF
ncbi:methylated-DNA--[protein]-cysteine S-methyltransferase [Lutibacter sp. B1]|uniref:methylated-DNA--[protein]-cysteine S-methyltransferase n=1 Tax=Lutibacter sp. B1 TaxID=2725996 RepID=UPI0014574151|nr:methylated-DNA--[protein]-cysteine S-methyltransferase [Lutibacter sp. B1]NLP57646.1 methylated-DNA--[protein]-cysteine S-methyltransferase [Lutibacter sp. B1]